MGVRKGCSGRSADVNCLEAAADSLGRRSVDDSRIEVEIVIICTDLMVDVKRQST